jgi:hypothetical protein
MLGNFTRNGRAMSALIKTAQQKWTLYLHAFLARVCSLIRPADSSMREAKQNKALTAI